ncbi:hypothetical protein E2C01_001225 [Portunus trituberculatus]|uniref:Uncharacterized protein n=1 Tax=Portunus trituberculatus TaxID=210409 RepID=A0A5B7CHA3_PORTR|nr:hypothetical protein [Portunus trituberculatus]
MARTDTTTTQRQQKITTRGSTKQETPPPAPVAQAEIRATRASAPRCSSRLTGGGGVVPDLPSSLHDDVTPLTSSLYPSPRLCRHAIAFGHGSLPPSASPPGTRTRSFLRHLEGILVPRGASCLSYQHNLPAVLPDPSHRILIPNDPPPSHTYTTSQNIYLNLTRTLP